MNPSPEHEPSASHDGERALGISLVSLHRVVEPGMPPGMSEAGPVQLMMPIQPTPDERK